ncbi:hypothetical protein [Saccharothrix sp. NRRL B-16348]|uniref:hypothetical protein n=1 Tax=Saccharothrix sp. NRRL B-16348 TaxID=1415542 RepID=UPI001E36DAD9|nr:hypothetical protein [Saccharothrix sp. NRRL B-16348]
MRLNRDVLNTELTKANVKLTVNGRNKLIKAGLLETNTDTTPYVHRITEEGIRWCESAAPVLEPPAGAGALVREGFSMLRSILPLLRRKGIGLLDIFRAGDDLESVIRDAYLELSVKPQDWVRLAKLRPKLNGADKAEVDEVLLEMVKTGTVHLAPDSNRKVLTDADHAAAVRVAGEDNHLVAIEES